MKKIAFIILTMITMPSYATTMCAANDTVAVILDPSIPSKKYTTDSQTRAHIGEYSYGILKGQYACHDSKTIKPLGGELIGRYCWARLTHPVLSKWMFLYDYGDNNLGNCKQYCGTILHNNASIRENAFSSITN